MTFWLVTLIQLLCYSQLHISRWSLIPLPALCRKSLNSIYFRPYFIVFCVTYQLAPPNASIISLKATDQKVESFRYFIFLLNHISYFPNAGAAAPVAGPYILCLISELAALLYLPSLQFTAHWKIALCCAALFLRSLFCTVYCTVSPFFCTFFCLLQWHCTLLASLYFAAVFELVCSGEGSRVYTSAGCKTSGKLYGDTPG